MCNYLNEGMDVDCFSCPVPNEYFSQIDMSGKRVDINQRPELLKGQVEFEAGAEYCIRPPSFPTVLFVIGIRTGDRS